MKEPRFRIRITRIGWLFIALTLGVGLSALNTGNNLIYLIFAMMLSFLILSGLLSNNTLRKLRVNPKFPHRIFAKQPTPVRIELENQKRMFPSFAIALVAMRNASRSEVMPFIMKVPAGERAVATDRIEFKHRGRHFLPTYSVESEYPFGLIRKYIAVPSSESAIVYPQLVPVDSIWNASHRSLGEFLSGVKGESANPYGIRDYVYGDPARLIHWKSSAKQGTWKVKEFEREKKLRVTLDVMLAPQESSESVYAEKAISVAASLLLELAGHGYEVSLRLNGESIAPSGRGYIDTFLTALAFAAPPIEPKDQGAPWWDGATIAVSDLPARILRSQADLAFGREQLEAM